LILMPSICISFLLWNFLQAFETARTSGDIISHMLDKSFLSLGSSITILCTALPPFAFIYLRIYRFEIEKSKFSTNINKIESDLRAKDARLVAGKLESVMSLTVEIANQVEINLARKLELDLRITDASYALEYYYSVANSKARSQPKRQKSSSIHELFRLFVPK
jgi:hypothetical protein